MTLLTCTPYGVNSHRLLVRGHRVYEQPEKVREESLPLSNMSLHTNYLLWVVVGLLITGVFTGALYLWDRRKGRRALDLQGQEKARKDQDSKAGEEE